ncbi:MAG: efflux RND transporter permease subunit, partial [Bacteroidota bacterium]
QGFFGAEIQRLQRGQDEVKVWVRYDAAERSSIGDLENMRIRTQTGQSIPLKELATLSVSRGVISINRLEGKREIRVEADMASDDASASAMIQTIETELLPPILSKYPSVSYSFEGQYRENAKTQASSGTVMPLVLILIFFIIMLTFRSLGQTLTVFSIIPFGLIGVILGHLIFNQQISVLSFLGVFALIGVLVNDALVFVSAHNILIKEGKPFREAIYEAGLSRFRPIFLTSLTTIAGLGPLIFEKSFQAQFLIPMAISIAFGLAIATLVILITLPSIMVLVNQYKVAMVHLWEGEKPDPTSVEPALLERKNYLVLWLGGPVVLGALIFFLTSLF